MFPTVRQTSNGSLYSFKLLLLYTLTHLMSLSSDIRYLLILPLVSTFISHNQ